MDPWDDVRRGIDAAKLGSNELALALKDIVKHESWRRFDQPTYGAVEHTTLREFIEARPNAGLGLTVEAVKSILKESNYTSIAYDLQRLLDAESPAAEPTDYAGPGRGKTFSDTKGFSTADSDRDYVLARLKRDRPDLAEEVIEGRMSADAAAKAAGIRREYIRVRKDDVGLAVKKLIEVFGQDAVRAEIEES